MKHTILLLIVMGLLSVGLAGCGSDKESAPAAEGPASAPVQKDTAPSAPEAPAAVEPPAPGSAAADGPAAGTESGVISADALLHRRFVLESVDGAPFAAGERVPELEFLEGFRVAGGFCNRFMGQGELDGGVLKVAQMASTKMLCVDEALNTLEGLFATMMQEGAAVAFDGTALSLSQGGRVLGWKLQDRVQ